MGTWQVALVREQGVEFGVVVVSDHVIDSPTEREKLLQGWTLELRRPVALLGAQRHRSYGRRDLVDWLSNVSPARLPWRQVTLN
jgi:hypothetical protein